MHRGKIVCLGDSLTYGYPYGPHASWVTYSSRACGLSISNAGVNGDTMEDMAGRFDRDVLGKKPGVVIILGGANDAFRDDVSRSMTISSLEEMIARSFANKIAPVIGIPIPVDDPMAESKLWWICQEYRRISTEQAIPLLDFRTPFIDPGTGRIRDELYLDGVHPNIDGYRVMGETATSFLNSLAREGLRSGMQ